MPFHHVTSSLYCITSRLIDGGKQIINWLLRGLHGFNAEMEYIPFGPQPTKQLILSRKYKKQYSCVQQKNKMDGKHHLIF